MLSAPPAEAAAHCKACSRVIPADHEQRDDGAQGVKPDRAANPKVFVQPVSETANGLRSNNWIRAV